MYIAGVLPEITPTERLIFLLILMAFFITYILGIIAKWKLFKKAGKNGWESIIPYYNSWVLIEIAGLNWWYFLILILDTILKFLVITGLGWLTTIASYFVSFLCYYNIAKKMKQNEILYGILGAFLPYVTVLILGFSKNIIFDNNIAVSPNGIIVDPKPNNNNNSNNQNQTPERYCLGCGQRLANNVKFCENCGKKIEDPKTTQQ